MPDLCDFAWHWLPVTCNTAQVAKAEAPIVEVLMTTKGLYQHRYMSTLNTDAPDFSRS
jgi:hypothetical protein